MRIIRSCDKIFFMINIIKKKLIDKGYKVTKARLEVIEFLLLAKKPISVQYLNKKITKINRASIYRTINILFKLDLLNKEIINREALYCLSINSHHHIICRKCGRIERIACQHKFNNINNFREIKHQLSLSGLCSNCD